MGGKQFFALFSDIFSKENPKFPPFWLVIKTISQFRFECKNFREKSLVMVKRSMGLLEEENYGKGGGDVFEFPVSKLVNLDTPHGLNTKI